MDFLKDKETTEDLKQQVASSDYHAYGFDQTKAYLDDWKDIMRDLQNIEWLEVTSGDTKMFFDRDAIAKGKADGPFSLFYAFLAGESEWTVIGHKTYEGVHQKARASIKIKEL